jgi:hypothetical protein
MVWIGPMQPFLALLPEAEHHQVGDVVIIHQNPSHLVATFNSRVIALKHMLHVALGLVTCIDRMHIAPNAQSTTAPHVTRPTHASCRWRRCCSRSAWRGARLRRCSRWTTGHTPQPAPCGTLVHGPQMLGNFSTGMSGAVQALVMLVTWRVDGLDAV